MAPTAEQAAGFSELIALVGEPAAKRLLGLTSRDGYAELVYRFDAKDEAEAAITLADLRYHHDRSTKGAR